jgi:hypothetical protein
MQVNGKGEREQGEESEKDVHNEEIAIEGVNDKLHEDIYEKGIPLAKRRHEDEYLCAIILCDVDNSCYHQDHTPGCPKHL